MAGCTGWHENKKITVDTYDDEISNQIDSLCYEV